MKILQEKIKELEEENVALRSKAQRRKIFKKEEVSNDVKKVVLAPETQSLSLLGKCNQKLWLKNAIMNDFVITILPNRSRSGIVGN